MKNFLASAFLIGLACTPCLAAEPDGLPQQSLFFTEEESRAIRELTATAKTERRTTNGIHLGAVIYYGPEDWTLWLQNQRWTPETDRPDMHIVSVEPNRVHVSWARSANETPRDIVLRPYQTYQIGSGRITEGEP